MTDVIGEAIVGEDFIIGEAGRLVEGVPPVDIPQFAAPFSISTAINPETGVSIGANEVEQDSDVDLEACVYNILVCPQGFRIEDPDFGIPPLQFGTVPLPASDVLAAVHRYEPRASLSAVESVLEGIEQQRALTVEVG